MFGPIKSWLNQKILQWAFCKTWSAFNHAEIREKRAMNFFYMITLSVKNKQKNGFHPGGNKRTIYGMHQMSGARISVNIKRYQS